MGLFTEREMERLSYASRLLKGSLRPSEFSTRKRMVTAKVLKERKLPPVRYDFLRSVVSQLVSRRKFLKLYGLDVDAILGCTDHLTAKREIGIKGPSAFDLLCWAEALGCQWVLVPKAGARIRKPKRGKK